MDILKNALITVANKSAPIQVQGIVVFWVICSLIGWALAIPAIGVIGIFAPLALIAIGHLMIKANSSRKYGICVSLERKEDSEWAQYERNHKLHIVYFDDFIKRSKYQDLNLPEGIDPAKGFPIAHIPKGLDITEMLVLKDDPRIVVGMLVRIDNEEEKKLLFDWRHSCEHFGTMAWIRPLAERSYREFWENYRNDNNVVVVGV
jgi:hypothetical protein